MSGISDSSSGPAGPSLGRTPEPLDDILDALRDGTCVYLSLAEAARLFPSNRGGRPVHISTLTRWVHDGVPARAPGRRGERLRLRAVRAPGRWMTTREWVAEFITALTADRAGQDAPPTLRPPSARRRAAERACRELDKIGI